METLSSHLPKLPATDTAKVIYALAPCHSYPQKSAHSSVKNQILEKRQHPVTNWKGKPLQACITAGRLLMGSARKETKIKRPKRLKITNRFR